MSNNFKIYAGIKTENYKKHVIDDFISDSPEEALRCAENYAYELYYQKPEKDILELKKECKCNEDEAEIKFLHIMAKSVCYWVEEETSEGIVKHMPNL